MREKLLVNQESAACTVPKAAAACITVPKVMVGSARYFGAISNTGTTGAASPLVLMTIVI